MLTYELTAEGVPLYQQLYQAIRADITAGRLSPDTKLPSKRSLADNLGISTITVENAYDQLISEGWVIARPRRGYFVAAVVPRTEPRAVKAVTVPPAPETAPPETCFDFSGGRTAVEQFPFSIWARLLREALSHRKNELLQPPPGSGAMELRRAISGHLLSFRAMAVEPEQIIVGAGTEYLYGLLLQLLGRQQLYCLENPGYHKLEQIYEKGGACLTWAGLDEKGLSADQLRSSGAAIVHLSPNHHFPTGITMPASRRYELLAWASEAGDRYIIEDDYDSEFRSRGRPLPTLFSIDACDRVIYMNTFTKSLIPTIRISYMVLPAGLAARFSRELGFYSCTVSSFEQYTLAAFISRGYFEKHINRMRLHYGRKRQQVLELLRRCLPEGIYRVRENDSGLHFLLELNTSLTDGEVKERLAAKGAKISAVTDFYHHDSDKAVLPAKGLFLFDYAGMELEQLEKYLKILSKILKDADCCPPAMK